MKHSPLIILFGSKAKGQAHKKSDTDIAVLSDHPLDLSEITLLSGEMAETLKVSDDDIDIVDLWTASPLLQYDVAKHGRLIEGDADAFLRFRVLAWKRYQDTAKFRRAREKVLEKTLHA